MANNRMVYHDGEVIGVEPQANRVKVKILSKSACADCHAKGVCTAADMDEKIIDAVPVGTLAVGDDVRIVMHEKLGTKAVFYGFFLPFLVMVTVLFLVNGFGGGEVTAALAGLGSLLPYYVLLYFFRSKVEKDFVFRAEKKNKF